MITQEQIEKLVQENRRRFRELRCDYNAVTGEGAPLVRERLEIEDHPVPVQWVPLGMMQNDLVKALRKYRTIQAFIEKGLKEEYTEKRRIRVIEELAVVRNRYDFIYWAYVFVKIKPKEGGEMIPFKLNYAQVRFFLILEDMRTRGIPIRIILLKARQWGGSTLTQMYIKWMQEYRHPNGWNAAIVAQADSTAKKIKAMYRKALETQPGWTIGMPGTKLQMTPYERSDSDFQISDGKYLARTSYFLLLLLTPLRNVVVITTSWYTTPRWLLGKRLPSMIQKKLSQTLKEVSLDCLTRWPSLSLRVRVTPASSMTCVRIP